MSKWVERTINLPILQIKSLLGMEVIDKGLLEEMGPELNLKQWAVDGGVHFWEDTKTTLRFSNSLGGFTEFSTAVILTVTVCNSKRIQIKIHNRKSLIRQSLGEFQAVASSCLFPVESSGHHLFLARMYVNTYGVLPTRETYPCHGVQNIFCGWSHRHG